MAKRDAPKKDNAKGRTKASARAGTRTAMNKALAADTRARRFQAAERRRQSPDYTVPMNAVIEARNPETNEIEIVPHPKRGKRIRLSATVRDARAMQSTRIRHKREQRRNFSRLSPKDKLDHREAGSLHILPRSILADRA